MKNNISRTPKGFTLIEVLVVITIMVVLMTMAGSVLNNMGKGKSIQAGVEQLDSFIREAQATAIGNDTLTRVVFINDEANNSRDSKHLRMIGVMRLRQDERELRSGKNGSQKGGGYDGTVSRAKGVWVSTSRLQELPANVYFSPKYSTPLEWSDDADGGSMLGNDLMSFAGLGSKNVYYMEFDEKGRFVAPMASPENGTAPQRVVLIEGKRSTSSRAENGIEPKSLDEAGRPNGARGLVLWPNGNVSRLRTLDQIEKVGRRMNPVRNSRSSKSNQKSKRVKSSEDKRDNN